MSWDCAVAVGDQNVKNVTAINLPINNVSLNSSTPRAIVAGMAIRFAIGLSLPDRWYFLGKGGFLPSLPYGATIGNIPTISPATQGINRFFRMNGVREPFCLVDHPPTP